MNCKYCKDTKKLQLLTSIVDCTECQPPNDNSSSSTNDYGIYRLIDGQFTFNSKEVLLTCGMKILYECNEEDAKNIIKILNNPPQYLKLNDFYLGHWTQIPNISYDVYFDKHKQEIILHSHNRCIYIYTLENVKQNWLNVFSSFLPIIEIHEKLGNI